jgi:hypothetical protein
MTSVVLSKEINTKDEKIIHLKLVSNADNGHKIAICLSPAWYDRRDSLDSRPDPPIREDHYVQIMYISDSGASVIPEDINDENEQNFTIKSFSYTHFILLGYDKEKIIVLNSDIAGITTWKGATGLNPVDIFGVDCIPIEKSEQKKYLDMIPRHRAVVKSPMNGFYFPSANPSIVTRSAPHRIFALSGMYDEKSCEGYCVGLSKAEVYDGVKVHPSARLWISAFSAPDFTVSEIKYKSETIVAKLPNIEESVLQEIYTGDVKKDRFTHLAASFFITVPLIACYNNQTSSIHVIDYDPNLKLTQSPSRQVGLPVEFRDREVDSLLLTAGTDVACLGIVFKEKNKEESKNFLLFQRTKESTDWKEFTRFELPCDSLSPTMCIQDGNLFYAYLQPTTVENSPQLVEKLGKTSPDKMIVIFKYSLTPNITNHQ